MLFLSRCALAAPPSLLSLPSLLALPSLPSLPSLLWLLPFISLLPSLPAGALPRGAPPTRLTQLSAVRVPSGDDAVWVAVDGHVLHVAWGDDARFERVEPQRAESLRPTSAVTSNGSVFAAKDHVDDDWDRRTGDPTDDTLRVGLVDDSTLVFVAANGSVSTLTRGGNMLEAAPDLDATLDLASLREVALGACSETGRWPARELGDVTWMPWTPCADFVRCAPPRLVGSPRRPVGLRISFTIRGALTGTVDRATTSMDDVPMVPSHGPAEHDGRGQEAFARGVTAAAAPRTIADSNAEDQPIASRRVAGLVSLLLTLRFDPRAVARERLAQSLTSRRDSTPLGADVVEALGADTARALICEGAP